MDLEGPDFDAPYGWLTLDGSAAQVLLDRLQQLETMTWAEIVKNKKKNHAVRVDRLCSAARRRLTDLRQEDVDELFSIGNLGSTLRLWGIRDRNVFKVLWFDPDHRVCPSRLRNT